MNKKSKKIIIKSTAFQKPKSFVFLLIVTLFIGFLVRLLSIQTKSFWFDEAFSYFVSEKPLPDLITATAADNHPPLYYILLHCWLNLGSSEVILRTFSLIFGVLTIPLIYLTGKKLHSEKVGLISTAIISLAPLQVYYSQETRMYSLAIFLNLLMFYCFYSLIKKETALAKAGFLITTVIGLYTHYYFVLSWISANLIYLILNARNRTKIIRWTYLQFIILLIYLPWMYVFQTNTRPQIWSYQLALAIPATFFSYAMGGLVPNNLKMILIDNPHQLIKLIGILLSLWMLFLFFYGIAKAFYQSKNGFNHKNIFANPFLLSASYLLIPIGIVTFISFIYPVYSLKSLALFSPFYYLSISIVIAKLSTKFMKNFVLLTILVLSLFLNFYMKTDQIFLGTPIKQVIDSEFINYHQGDALAHASIYSYYPFRYYHRDQLNEYLIFESGLSQKTIEEIGGNPVPLEYLLDNYHRLWLIGITFLSPAQEFQSIVNSLSANYQLQHKAKYENIEVYLFDLRTNN